MGTRPLRQYYDGEVRLHADEALGSVVEPWRRHRERLLDELAALDESHWSATSRCEEWTTKDVVLHLLSVDVFGVMAITAGRAGTPTQLLRAFDPSVSPGQLVEPSRGLGFREVLDQFAASTATFVGAVESLGDELWTLPAESPVGRVPARLMLAHLFWDSWLHERDILVPLGLAPDIDTDELHTAIWYGVFVAATQGGLIGDDAAVGPGLAAPFDLAVAFDDLPGRAIRVRVDAGVEVSPAERGTPVGPALDIVEAFTGRAGATADEVEGRLPPEVAAHLARARDVL